ncbi:MAG: two-component system, OmpR family, sensor histidine kinase MprB [Solirubrobacterales bacterium]|nr:two-component system, OmpR family, sensor histidine kinase MprB [Solirubrobacterales bacterium]
MSLRRRIILLAAGAVALAICAAALTSWLLVRSELRGQVDNVLTTAASRFQQLPKDLPRERHFAGKRLKVRPPRRDSGPPGPPGDADIFLVRLNARGALAEPRPPETGPLTHPTARERTIARTGQGSELVDRQLNGDHYRVLTEPLKSGGAVILARSLQGVDDVLGRLRVILALVALGGIGLAALLAWLVSREVIAPIRRLTATAEHIGATDDLSRRIEVGRADEVGRLASRFNEMLDSLQSSRHALAGSVEAQRQLVADASHELRTPVASLRTDIEVMLEHPNLPAAEQGRLLAAARDRAEELGQVIGDLIELARGERAVETHDEVRLDRLAGEAVDRFRRLAPGRRFDVDVEPVVVTGDPERLARAVNNLLDNASKYSPAEQPIEVTVTRAALSVRDHGPGVAEAEVAHIFDRFNRGARGRDVPGSGLGLAIVRQVAEAHGGTATVENAQGGGAVFRLILPSTAFSDGR